MLNIISHAIADMESYAIASTTWLESATDITLLFRIITMNVEVEIDTILHDSYCFGFDFDLC